MTPTGKISPILILLWIVALMLPGTGARAYDVVLSTQGEYIDAYLVNGTPFPPRVVFDDPDPLFPNDPNSPPPRVGRHLNGKVCFFPRHVGRNGQFVVADDTYREACIDRATPQARCSVTDPKARLFVGTDPDGWSIFKKSGRWNHIQIHVPWNYPTDPQPQGTVDPQGCAFDAQGRLFATDVGSGNIGSSDGALLVFFPGPKKRYDTYCFLDKALGAPSMPVMDASGTLYVPESAAGRINKFSAPFPSSAADCANPDHLVTTPPTKTLYISFATTGILTPSGIARVPGTDHFYVGSVFVPNVINEYDANGVLVRNIVPAGVPKNPIGMDVGSDGTIYYAELNLDPMTFSPRCGRVSMVRFDDNNNPLPPQLLGINLRFPDGITVVDSKRLRVNLLKLPLSPELDPSQCGGGD